MVGKAKKEEEMKSMRLLPLPLVVIAALFTLAFAWSPTPLFAEEVANIVPFKGGEKFVYKTAEGDVTFEIFEVLANGNLITSPFPGLPENMCNCRLEMDRNGTVVRVLDQGGKDLQRFDYIKGWLPLQFPMSVGMGTWKERGKWPVGGTTYEFEAINKVIRLTEIKTPIGKRKVFEIQRDVRNTNGAWSKTETRYYDPELGVMIKRDAQFGIPYTLKSFSQP